MSALGEVEPLSRPGNGEFTAWENAFYTGDPNCAGTLPVADESFAVLKVTALGSGEGNLIVGKTCVPLLPGAPALMIAVPKGVRIKTKYEGDGSVGCRLDSDDFCIGEMPSGWLVRTGWLAFPYTEPSHPCIHTLDENKVTVTLDPGSDIKGLVCTWSGNGGVSVEALSPLSARLKLDFPRNDNTYITYQLSHANYLCGKREFRQRCEYCPKVHDEEDEDGGIWYVNKDYFEDEDADPPMLGRRVCPVHHVEYSECEVEHAVKYEDATNGVPYSGQLKLHFPLQVADHRLIDVHVPTGECRCCSCPEHWKNYVAIGARSRHLAVHLGDDPFVRTTEDCTLDVFGASPSADFADATLSLCKTGVIYETHNYTVFGVSITGYGKDLRRFNELSPEFGLPVTIQTNANDAVMLGLRTDVDLPYGTIRVAIENATARIQLVKYDVGGNHKVILDSETNPVLELPLGEWRRLTKSHTWGRTTQLSLLAYSHGKADIFFGYAAEHNGEYLHDESTQRITVIRPPLLPDYNRDGKIDDTDAKLASGHRFYFWTNKDCWKDDLAFSESYYEKLKEAIRGNNGGDDMVNGRNDLVNQLPVALYVNELWEHWKNKNVKFKIRGNVNNKYIRRCYADTSWDAAKASVLEDVEIDDESHFWQLSSGDKLCDAKMKAIGYEEDEELSPERLARCLDRKGMIYLEAAKECCNPLRIEVVVDDDDKLLYSYTPELYFSDVETMYRWHNIRGFADKSGVTVVGAESFQALPSPVGWPDDERDDANFYFVHGYNVSEQEARDWGQAFFKRMWWAGMNAKFHIVTWFGNETQQDIPIVGLVTPNYHVNVENAFASSKAFVELVKKYPGKNYVAAHSLGNMLVSSAIQDWNLPHEMYFMINAAVAAEAYDTAATTDKTTNGMTPGTWRNVPLKYRSTHWFELDDFAQNDARRQLTWRNRFNKIGKAVNYYSSEEEVLKCDLNGYGKWKLQRDWSWYNQERIKGENPVPGSRDEGGWAYNAKYKKPEYDADGHGSATMKMANPTLEDIKNIRDDLRCYPVFKPFEDTSLMTADFVPSISRGMVSQLLADAIPAESFPAGFNEVPKWIDERISCQNVNMSQSFKANDGIYFWWWEGDWGHSFFLDAPYMVVHGLFEDMKGRMK